MKVYFVGIHDKPGMPPLSSKTMTGRVIDRIIERLQLPAVKTNLFQCTFIPEMPEALAWRWKDRNPVTKNDIIVLLGKDVEKYFPSTHAKVVNLPHPGAIRFNGVGAADRYVENAVQEILSLTPTTTTI